MFYLDPKLHSNKRKLNHETPFFPQKQSRLDGRNYRKKARNQLRATSEILSQKTPCSQLSITKEQVQKIFGPSIGPKKAIWSLRDELTKASSNPLSPIEDDDEIDPLLDPSLVEEDPFLNPSFDFASTQNSKESSQPIIIDLEDEQQAMSDREKVSSEEEEEEDLLLLYEKGMESSGSTENSLSADSELVSIELEEEKQQPFNPSSQNFYLKRAYFDSTFSEKEKQKVRKLAAKQDAAFDDKWLKHIHGRMRTLDANFVKNTYPSNVEVAYCETIKSYGLRATKQIQARTLIGLYTGKVVRDADHRKEQVYFFGICPGYSIDAADEGSHARYINHGGKNNNAAAYQFFLEDSDAPQIAIVSEKTIKVGEWIHLDYGNSYFKSLEFTPSALLPTDP